MNRRYCIKGGVKGQEISNLNSNHPGGNFIMQKYCTHVKSMFNVKLTPSWTFIYHPTFILLSKV